MRTAIAVLACLLSMAGYAVAQYQQDIRVVLGDNATSYTVAGDLVWYIDDRGAGSTSDQVLVSLSGSQVIATIAGNRHSGSRLVAEARTGNVRCLNNQYHGRIEFFRGKSGSLVALNVLPLDDYIAGVVPSEMPQSWPAEALKAQAVAARTYAVSRMAANRQESYDVYATVADQAYRGASGEQQSTSDAVKQTSGQVLTYNGEIIVAYYSSDAGGYTKDGGLPYLKSVPSYVPDSPHNGWSVSVSSAELLKIARGIGFTGNSIDMVKAENDPVSGHLLRLTLSGSGGSVEISGTQLRKTMGYTGLKSTRVTVSGDGEITTPAPPPYIPPPVKQTPVVGQQGVFALFAYNRPWVAFGGGVEEIKLRRLYAYNGWDLEQCNRDVFAVAGARFDIPEPVTAIPVPAARQSPAVVTTVNPGSRGIVLNGSGYGHGIGMSQWGARQLALEGRDYAEILRYFYSGVDLAVWDGSLSSSGFIPDVSGFYDPFEVQMP